LALMFVLCLRGTSLVIRDPGEKRINNELVKK
jgi:hypothetical protein